MVSTILIAVFAVVGVIATVGISQTEQIQEMFKPSATECEFAGQRLNEDYYCVYRNDVGNRGQYLDVEKISENQIPQCSSVRMEGVRIDANGNGEFTANKESNCSDSIKVIAVGGNGEFTANQVLNVGESKVLVPFSLGTSIAEGSKVSVSVHMLGGASSVTSATVLPAGQVQQQKTNNSPQTTEQDTSGVVNAVGAQDIQPWQRIFVKELYNSDVELPGYTGIHTSNAKGVSISVESDSLVKVTIDGTDCMIQGYSFDRMCDVPSNSDVVLRVDGSGQAHVIIRLHYIF